MSFAEELARYGPESGAARASLSRAEAYTTALARGHYENFPVLSRFVPPELRQHFANLYAYCRWSDDIGDEVGDPQRSLELFDWWEGELDRCLVGTPSHPVMVALQATIGKFGIPRQPFADLLKAFRRDQSQTRYATFDELRDYCRCSADPVGRLVLYVCERFTDDNAALSDQVCTGLQLANLWQDVSIDVRKGRVYLPAEDLDRFGVREVDLQAGTFTPAFAELMRFEVERAEEWLRRGRPLAVRMPGRLRIVIALFVEGGLGILQKTRAIGYNVLSQRPKLTKLDLARIMTGAAWGATWGPSSPAVNEAPSESSRRGR